MMRTKRNSNILSFLSKPLYLILLFFSLFGLVCLRSSVVSVAYEIRNLEVKKMGILRDRDLLLAERANLMSLEKINESLSDYNRGDSIYAESKYGFPDRKRVVHIKTYKRPGPFNASLDVRGEK